MVYIYIPLYAVVLYVDLQTVLVSQNFSARAGRQKSRRSWRPFGVLFSGYGISGAPRKLLKKNCSFVGAFLFDL